MYPLPSPLCHPLSIHSYHWRPSSPDFQALHSKAWVWRTETIPCFVFPDRLGAPLPEPSPEQGSGVRSTLRCTDSAWSRPCHPQEMDLTSCCQGQRGQTLSRHLLTAVSLGSCDCRAAALSVCSETSGNPWMNIFLALLLEHRSSPAQYRWLRLMARDKQITNHLL